MKLVCINAWRQQWKQQNSKWEGICISPSPFTLPAFQGPFYASLVKNKPEPSSEGQRKKASARKNHQYLALHLKSLSTALLLIVPGQANPHLLPGAGLDSCHRVTRSLGQSWCAPTAQSSYRWPWPAAKADAGTTRNHIHNRTKSVAKLGLSGKCLTQLLLCWAWALRHLCIPHLVTLLQKLFSAASSQQQKYFRLNWKVMLLFLGYVELPTQHVTRDVLVVYRGLSGTSDWTTHDVRFANPGTVYTVYTVFPSQSNSNQKIPN